MVTRTGRSRNRTAVRSQFPNADDEYTPERRRIIDARLAEALADIKASRTFGPFNTAREMIVHMKADLKNQAAATT